MITIRKAQSSDAELLHHLARLCPPLDLHTNYTYWVAAAYFGSGSYILEDEGESVGYIMTVSNDKTLFVWQIGILERYRGQGLSRLLIDRVLDDAAALGKVVEVTISPQNTASRAAFAAASSARCLKMEPIDTLELRDLDDPCFFETEVRYRIS